MSEESALRKGDLEWISDLAYQLVENLDSSPCATQRARRIRYWVESLHGELPHQPKVPPPQDSPVDEGAVTPRMVEQAFRASNMTRWRDDDVSEVAEHLSAAIRTPPAEGECVEGMVEYAEFGEGTVKYGGSPTDWEPGTRVRVTKIEGE